MNKMKEWREIAEAQPSYSRIFNTPDGEVVLKDLMDYCQPLDGCWDADPRLHALYEGRRQVFLRIARYLYLNTDQLFTLYQGGRNLQQPMSAPLSLNNTE